MNSAQLYQLHTLATAAMFGVIWLVQLTHYPTFRFVEPAQFPRFCRFHSNSISFVVGPLMLVELGTALLLLASGTVSFEFKASIVVLALIWTSTFAIQVPLHSKLEQGYDPQVIRRLVNSNLIRAIGWSVRIALLTI